MAERKHSVVREASFLMVAQLICSVIGLLYRSPLHAIMGDVGDGYYTFAYEWYTIILLISSYSIPSAVSKVMAERLAQSRYKDAQKVFYAALIYVLVVGGIGAMVAFFGAPFILSEQPDAVLSLRVLSPTILLSGFLGCLRGYFQAHNTMMPRAISNVAEQVVNAVMSVLAAYLLTRPYLGNEGLVGKYGAAGGTIGTGSGVLIGILFMLFVYFINRKVIRHRLRWDGVSEDEPYKEVFKVIFLMVTPILFATCIYNLTTVIDQKIFMRLLTIKGQSAMDISRQYALFGYRFRPIVNIPIGLSSATATALIPAVASSMAARDEGSAVKKIDQALKLSSLIAIPSAVGLCVLSYPVIRILYPSGDVRGAAILLSIGAVSVVFYSLSTVTNGILQGLGHPAIPVRNAAIAIGVNVLAAIFFVGILNFGVRGILLAVVLYALVVMLLNAYALRRILSYRHDLKKLVLQPFLAALLMGAAVGILYWLPSLLLKNLFARYLPSALLCFVAILVGVLVYIVSFVKIANPSTAELLAMPAGARLLRVLQKLHIRQ